MRIFVSYSHAQAAVTEALAANLRNAGHAVFYDKESLPAAESYDDRIRAAIARTDLFIFMISPESVSTGRYTLTELKFARERWPRAGKSILPVMAAETPIEDVPAYLKAINILKPEGNLVAEVAALVEKHGGSGPMLRIAGAVAIAALVVGALGGGAWWISQNAAQQVTKVVQSAQVDACAVVNELLQVKSPDQLSQAASKQAEMCRELSALQGGDPRERQVADLMAQGEIDQALTLLEQMAKGPPEKVENWERLATLSVLRDPDQALRAREAIERLAPQNVANRLQLAQLYAAAKPDDWLRVNQDILASATDPMAKAIANWSLCSGSLPLTNAHPEWNCATLDSAALIKDYGASQLDKRYASNAAMIVLVQRVALMSIMGGATGADPEAMIKSLTDMTEGLKFFSQEQLKFVTNKNMGELLQIQADEATITGDMIGQMMTAARAQDLPGVRKALAETNVKLDAVAARARSLAAAFNSPLVTAEQASIAHTQGLLLLQEAVIGGGSADADRQAAIKAKLKEATAQFRAVHDRSPKIGMPMLALVMLTQWIQAAEQGRADWLGSQLAADQLMWVDIVAQQKPGDPTTRLMLLQAHYLVWRYAEPAAKAAELQKVEPLLREMEAQADLGGAKPIVEAIRAEVSAPATETVAEPKAPPQ